MAVTPMLLGLWLQENGQLHWEWVWLSGPDGKVGAYGNPMIMSPIFCDCMMICACTCMCLSVNQTRHT